MHVRDGEDGAAIVEFAIVTTLLSTLLLGIVSYGLILGLHQSITHAASEAARAAIAAPNDLGAVEQVAHDRLSWLPGDRRSLVAVAASHQGCANCIHVTVSYPYAGNELVPSFLPTPAVLSSTAVLDLGDR